MLTQHLAGLSCLGRDYVSRKLGCRGCYLHYHIFKPQVRVSSSFSKFSC